MTRPDYFTQFLAMSIKKAWHVPFNLLSMFLCIRVVIKLLTQSRFYSLTKLSLSNSLTSYAFYTKRCEKYQKSS